MNLKERDFEGGRGVDLAEGLVQWQALALALLLLSKFW